jgi:hypothetical protein
MHTLMPCPDPLPDDLVGELSSLARLWARHADCPHLDPRTALYWDELINSWSTDPKLPLLIRKREKGVARGEIIRHVTGRELVLTDNSPASWSYMLAFAGEKPSIEDIRVFLERDEIPVSMVVDRQMKARSRYLCSKVSVPNPNKLGWKVCHIKRVGLGGRGSVKERPIHELESHFRTFLAPSNMFLVPLALGGLGELPQFIEAMAPTRSAK